MGKSSIDSPDYGKMVQGNMEIAEMARELAQEQIDFARERYAENAPMLRRAAKLQMRASREQFKNAKQDRRRYERVFQKLEDRYIKDAEGYDTPGRRDRMAGRAGVAVQQNYEAARQNALRRLEALGVDPSQAGSQALDLGMRVQQAADQAGAETAARERVETVGRALRADAMNLGRGMPSQVAQGYGGAVQAGSAGTAGTNQTTATNAGALASATPALGTAGQSYGTAGSLQNQQYQNELQGAQWGASGWGGLGTLAGQLGSSWMIGGGGNPFKWRDGGAIELNDGGLLEGAGRREVEPGGAIPLANGGYAVEGGNRARPGAMAAYAAADGGSHAIDGMHQYPDGATVEGPGGPIDDQVPALLSSGEYVISADVVRAKGTEFFDKLMEKYHTPAEEQRRGTPPGGPEAVLSKARREQPVQHRLEGRPTAIQVQMANSGTSQQKADGGAIAVPGGGAHTTRGRAMSAMALPLPS